MAILFQEAPKKTPGSYSLHGIWIIHEKDGVFNILYTVKCALLDNKMILYFTDNKYLTTSLQRLRVVHCVGI